MRLDFWCFFLFLVLFRSVILLVRGEREGVIG